MSKNKQKVNKVVVAELIWGDTGLAQLRAVFADEKTAIDTVSKWDIETIIENQDDSIRLRHISFNEYCPEEDGSMQDYIGVFDCDGEFVHKNDED